MKTKKTNEGRDGGLVDGDFHSDPSGGVKTVITDAGNKPLLVEKNEVVIKKEAVQDPNVRTITGTNKEILHKINTSAGGTPILAEGGQIEDKDEIYSKWKRLVNMSASELQAFLKTPEGKKAGLTYEEAKKEGINNGKQSAKWIIRMKNTPKDKWSKAMWKWANKQISFISRMSGVDGALYDEKGNKTRKHTALLIWGHNPKKMSEGGEVKEEQLSGESQYVINYLRSKKLARTTLKKSNPKYEKQIEGLQDAIKHGYVVLRENPINDEVYIMPTLKLRDTYKFELGGEI